MAICLELEPGHSGVRVRVVTKASVGVMVRFYFAVVLVTFFTILCIRIVQSRCGMGTALGLGLGSRG